MEEILFDKPNFDDEEKYLLEPFFTNLNKSVYAILFLPPEVVGALCSRASRAKEDLRIIFLKEFVRPFLESEYGQAFKNFVDFLHQNSYEVLFANPKAREFYVKWLAEYGDDSIAQMAGTHLVYSSLSQIAIKHIENQRIGIAPIEKSTRYVDYSLKINNHYLYFTPPEIKKIDLKEEYEEVMDNLFETYTLLYQKYFDFLKNRYPEEKEIVLKTKAFDVVRLILPLSTLGQLALFGNGQAFEYLINRSLNHPLEEIRWLGKRAKEELDKIIPAFLRRIEKEESKEYRKYLGERSERIKECLANLNNTLINADKDTPIDADNEINVNPRENPSQTRAKHVLGRPASNFWCGARESAVKLIEYDKDGEDKIIAGLLYQEIKEPWEKIFEKVKRLSVSEKEKILEKVLKDRKYRWYKVPRAFENVYLRFEILTNIGAWRDLQRHRMQTQIYQKFNIDNGFDIPEELEEVGLKEKFISAIENLEKLYQKIEDKDLAQYAVSFAHRVRFLQYQNLRQFFWETELRTTPQGHPHYRKIEQEKAKIIEKIYPLISKYLLVDFQDYEFARRESVKKIEEKLKKLSENE
jgi:thymidylate synthase ThyX